MHLLIFWALFACLSPPGSLERQPPPPQLKVSPLVAGEQATVHLDTPLGGGASVSFAIGRSGRGPCPPALGGACLGILNPALAGRTTTDAAGVAVVNFTVTAGRGDEVALQAVVLTPAGPRLSGVVSSRALDPALDNDADGLSNAAEVRAGTDPRLGDTDGGGILDGQELLVDHTDPADPADDVGHETWCLQSGTDDDRDRRTDCADPDCDPICGEQCFDRRDNDLNGLTDCADPVCAAVAGCFEDCDNRVDDDRDGLRDCEDPDCPPCLEDCHNGRDDDLDLAPDCFDTGCRCVETCTGGGDEDADGLIDCDDPDCPCAERCDNNRDDDRDLQIDCLDPDCSCVETCADGVDGDGDGLSGCADPDCVCGELCDNGSDDDGDGLVDCEDAGCTDLCVETCHNGADDDGDQWIDCQDEECWSAAGCEPDAVIAWVRAGTLRASVQDARAIGSSCLSNFEDHSRQATAMNVAGRVRVEHGGRVETCDWRVDRATMRSASGFGFVSSSQQPWLCMVAEHEQQELRRAGFRVERGCGVTDSAFLPPHLQPEVERGTSSSFMGPFVGTARARSPQGGLWYQGGLGVGLDQVVLSSGGWGDYFSRASAESAPLEPVAPWGSCAQGTPALVTSPTGEVGATCLP